MLSFDEIRNHFDQPLSGITAHRAMVKEYLQCKTLEVIFQGPYKKQLIFIGGTKLRLFNNFQRFSEDLDFDIKGSYSEKDHQNMCENIVKSFAKQNILAVIDTDKKAKIRSAFTRYILFPGILEKVGLTDHPKRKFFLKIDAQKHQYGNFTYNPLVEFLNRFDVFAPISVAPDEVIFATKLCSILERAKGRDFWDIVELSKTVRPDLAYIKQRLEHGQMKTQYKNPQSYIDLFRKKIKNVDWKNKKTEIEKFIFDPKDSAKVLHFMAYASNSRVNNWLEQSDSSNG